LNLLQLAPGGHLGRFVIWTQSAFDKLDTIYGTHDKPSTAKKGYKLPRSIMANSDLTRIINSDEIQSIVSKLSSSTLKQLAFGSDSGGTMIRGLIVQVQKRGQNFNKMSTMGPLLLDRS
jgi:hypothetical protein